MEFQDFVKEITVFETIKREGSVIINESGELEFTNWEENDQLDCICHCEKCGKEFDANTELIKEHYEEFHRRK